MTTAGAGVNTFFPVVVENAGLDMGKIELVNVAEGALVSSYLQNLAPAILAASTTNRPRSSPTAARSR
jgi:NitT/TauT family transport system substrate-binding protein